MASRRYDGKVENSPISNDENVNVLKENTGSADGWERANPKQNKRRNKKTQNKPNNVKAENKDSKSTDKPLMNGIASGPAKSEAKDGIDDSGFGDTASTAVALKHLLTKPQLASENHAKTIEVERKVPVEKVKADSMPSKDTEKNPIVRVGAAARIRTTSESSVRSNRSRKGHKNHLEDDLGATDSNQLQVNAMHNKKSIEKSVKDLQRYSASFGRARSLLNDEIDESSKNVKKVFEKLTNMLMDREVQLFRLLDLKKEEARSMLSKREAKAAELRKKTERAASMNPQQLNQLRNDVKHFVSERHFDEELGKGVQFVYDAKVLENIPSFGELAPSKNFAIRHRERYESASSDAPLAHADPPRASNPPSHPPPLVSATPAPPASNKDAPSSRHESISWAESEDSHTASETLAPWATDTPLVSPDQTATSKDSKNKNSPPRERNKPKNKGRGNKIDSKNPSNKEASEKSAPSKMLSKDGKGPQANQHKEGAINPPRTPQENKPSLQNNEQRPRVFDRGDYPRGNRFNHPRGRGGFRGGFRGARRGGYRGSYGPAQKFSNERGGYSNDARTHLNSRNHAERSNQAKHEAENGNEASKTNPNQSESHRPTSRAEDDSTPLPKRNRNNRANRLEANKSPPNEDRMQQT